MGKHPNTNGTNLEKSQEKCTKVVLECCENLLEDQTLLKTVNTKLKSSKNLSEVVSTVIETSQEIRQREKWEAAVKLLEQTINSCGEFKEDVSEETYNLLKIELLQELKDTFYWKGQLNKLEDVLDAISTIYKALGDSKNHFKTLLKKAELPFYKGDFSRSKTLLSEVLESVNKLPEEKKRKILPEVQRNLGMAYRGYGDYEYALKCFSKSYKGFQEIQDSEGMSMTLWGIAILHDIRGEWAKAIEKYELILTKYYTKDIPYQIKLYLALSEPLLSSGDYPKCEEILQKALTLTQKLSKPKKFEFNIQLQFAKLYLARKMLDEALKTVEKVRGSIEKISPSSELKILEIETEILIELDQEDVARQKLEAAFPDLTNAWDIATWYLLMGLVEKKDMNFRSAQEAYEQATAKAREIGHYKLALTCQLGYICLLTERAKLGDQRAYEKASNLINELENEAQAKSMPPMTLEMQLRRANLFAARKNYDQAYELLSAVEENARAMDLNRHLDEAQNTLDLLEQERHQLQEGMQKTRYTQILKYLQEARRIVEEGQ
ncbi:MAG: tetratricopeptide repeat protein [Candidatus Hodarchaeota archaeon]